MLNYIRIFGTRDKLHSLPLLEGMEIRHKTANELEDGNWEVFVYASDANLLELESQEFEFEIHKSSAEQNTHFTNLENYIGENNQGIA